MVKSVEKGKSVERLVARLLSEITGKEWHRVPHSGAFSKFSKDRAYQGDLICDDEEFRDWVVEVKGTKEVFKCYDFLKGHHLIKKWIAQVERESKGKPWVLVIKDYRMPKNMFYAITSYYPEWLSERNIGIMLLDGYTLFIIEV